VELTASPSHRVNVGRLARGIADLSGALRAMIKSLINAANAAPKSDYTPESDNQFDF
jgi:hypothetical protein